MGQHDFNSSKSHSYRYTYSYSCCLSQPGNSVACYCTKPLLKFVERKSATKASLVVVAEQEIRMGLIQSKQTATIVESENDTTLEDKKPPLESRKQLPPCPPIPCAPCSCTKVDCASVCEPRETQATPANRCGSCGGPAISAACCGPCQVIPSNMQD